MSTQGKSKLSKTAQGTCLMRAVSYYEKDLSYQGEDFIAPMLLPSHLNAILKYNFARSFVKKSLFKVPGIYEYVIARTRTIDELFKSLPADVEQVLILGAGFDSRAFRFRENLQNAKVFELDALPTQQAKLGKLSERNIAFPQNVKFISIDFNVESLNDKLDEAGFQKNCRSFFLLEGLTYYLTKEAIDRTLTIITDYAGMDSILAFDYVTASASIQEKIQSDAKMKKNYKVLAKADETPGFMLEGQTQDFLNKYDFSLIKESNSAELAAKYFGKKDFELAAQMYRIVTAKKMRKS